MIALIVLISAILILVLLALLNKKYNGCGEHEGLFISSIISSIIALVCCFIFIFALVIGHENNYTEGARDKRELIEYRLKYEEEYNPDTVAKINSYNSYIEYGNNYFCRFTIKDNSIYLIDVNVYLNKFKK